MATPENEAESHRFLERAAAAGAHVVLKIVVFDEADYVWASALRARTPAATLPPVVRHRPACGGDVAHRGARRRLAALPVAV